MLPDDKLVTCHQNAKHGHPDEDAQVSLRYLRFLDSVQSPFWPEDQRGTPAQQASRAVWALTQEITAAEVEAVTTECWSAKRVVSIRWLIWSDDLDGADSVTSSG